jgi:sugar O-acyltransferase (sialic acid O-acetyltransferase NeuD family)
MKQLLIIGARGWGREVYQAIKQTPEVLNGEMEIKGFLDSKYDAFDGLRGYFPPIICSPEDYIIQPDDIFFVAMGDPHWRKHYAEMIEAKGGHFYSYLSPNADIIETASIGAGSFIGRWTIVSDNVTLGKHVIMHAFSVIGHDAVVKDYGTLLNAAFMGGYSEIGECSEMNPKSMIIPHKKIGDNVVVGAASVVMRNVKDGDSVFGNPAIKLKY